jgi:AraC family transcriptional regulator of adaptative response / DNA-3-methyladenine glycosylase II
MHGLGVSDNGVYERARLSRDARFDGCFFIGVKTTGIYCRPICPANPPKSDNVLFFASAAAASEAGFRPCLRCRPECAPGSPAWAGTSTTVQRGLRLIAEGALDEGDVENLANRLGVTSRHLRRLFARHVGASPVAVAHTQRLHFAKRLIDQTALPMKEISAAAGYGSVRRFNDAFRKTYDRSPRELRRARGDGEGGGQLRLTLPYREPFDWDRLISFFAARAIPGLEQIVERRYQRAVRLGDKSGVVEVQDEGGAISLTIHGIGTELLFPVAQRVRSMFDVDAPIDDIVDVLGRDQALRDRLRDHPGLRVPGAWDGWELAVRAILGQQVSVKAATTLAGRVVDVYGETLAPGTPDRLPSRLFPAPVRLLRARLEKLGIVRSRARSIRELARAVLDGRVRFDATQQRDAFRKALTGIPGIGDWTADYVAMRALKDPNAFPSADLGLLRAFDGVAGRRLRPRELAERAEDWRPWRAYAALLIWNSGSGGGG